MSFILDGSSVVLGTCYYPEHWDKSLWESDLERMKRAGLQVIRVAEFSWSITEREEGVFDFSFWQAFLDLAEKAGMKVIFGTPTATPPVWLTEKYPEVLNADIDGHLLRHGCRRHYNYNSPVYQRFCQRIVEKLAQRFGQHPAIIGWQIDNELNCEKDVFYSESDTLAFRIFLKEKYGEIGSLNRAWGTVFWNQTYNDFSQIYVPRTTCNYAQNPHHMLDYFRFISDSACRFAKMQSDILRRYIKPGDFITTNGLFAHLDNRRLTKESLDFITYDSYPNFAYCLDDYRENDVLKDRRWVKDLAQTRAISPIFGIMEQQSGANGWTTRMEAPTPQPGQMTLWAMQSLAHGADYISFFRWRTCTFGTEMYWHGILDYSGRENRRLRELTALSENIRKLQIVAGAKYVAKVGILQDEDNILDAELDHWHGRMEKQSQQALLEACQLTHTPFDYIPIDDESSAESWRDKEVLFYPHPLIITQKRVDALKAYVEQGGILVLGCRSGQKDLNGHCVQEKLPGLFRELTGADVPEYSFVPPDEGKMRVNWNGETVEAAVFTDLLSAEGENTQVLAAYENECYQGVPALLCRTVGKGRVYTFGGAFAQDTARAFLKNLGVMDPYGDLFTLPEGCEIAVREKDGQRFCFLLNYEKEAASVKVLKPMKDLLSGRTLQGEVTLPAYGTLVLEMP